MLVDELARLGVAVGGRDGLNIWLPVTDEATALVSLASRGIGAAPGSPFLVRPGLAPHLRVTSGVVATRSAEVAAMLADAAAGGVRSARR